MFDIGWTELLVIGVVALIVIGPKDLPGMFHTLGRVVARVRSMGREFTRAMEDAARESGVNDVTKDLRDIANPRKMGLDAVKDAASKFESWDPLASGKAAKPSTPKGPNTQKLSEERAEAAKKIREATAAKAQARLDAEAKATEEAAEPAKPAAKKDNHAQIADQVQGCPCCQENNNARGKDV
jgi:sec-independent protein translocase protein TatB